MMLRVYLLILISLLGLIKSSAQKLKVESFAVKPNDLTARTQTRQDGNGVECALVKVQLASSGATFAGNVVGDVKYNTSEYWVYMAQGSKRLTIKIEGYLPLEVCFEDYEVKTLESKTVYVTIISGISSSHPLEAPRIKTGWIILDSKPTGASVFINEEFVGNTPLANYKQAYGTYSYRIDHPNYHSFSGKLELNSDKLEKMINLKPAFGSIDITSNVAGATVLLDGKSTNKTTPCTLVEVPSGQHTITIKKDKYSPRQQSVIIEDEQTLQVSFSLDARFAQVKISSLEGAQIYCNGKLVGTTSHIEDMMEGYYDIEARLNHHKPLTKQIQVIAGQPQEITINPTPICGSLDVTSIPHEADVTIDGKQYGKTPLTIEKILEGEHSIVLNKEGYSKETSSAIIHENENTFISILLKERTTETIYLNEGESLQSKIKNVTWPVTQLKIVGQVGLSNQDWESLKVLCKRGDFKSLDIQELVGVTEIPNKAFKGCFDLTSIIIPNSVKKIGSEAFYDCSALTSLTIPNSVTDIGIMVFCNCTNLTSLTVEKGNKFYDSILK